MKNEDFFVSVIIPVHNGERFLAEAVRSVLEQDYEPLEIIIVDDGSTDNTADIASCFEGNIRYIYQPNRGPSAARNLGIRMAAGNVIAFLDVDDLWTVDNLKRQIAVLAADPSVKIVQGLIQQMQLDTSASNVTKMVFEKSSEPYAFINLGSAIYRSSVFEKVGLFDETLFENEDTDWFFRAWENSISKVVLNRVTLFYRIHDHNMSLKQNLVHFGLIRLFKKHLDRYREKGIALSKPSIGFPSISEYIGGPPAHRIKDRLKDNNFTIISNDCWGAGAYGSFRLMYKTPFIGTRVFAPCYIELLKDLRNYIESPLTFIDVSRYDFMNEHRKDCYFPIGILNGRVEIHFYHEDDEEKARQKWQRRIKKMNWDNIFVKFSEDPGVCREEHLKEFEELDYPYKVCFTSSDYSHLKSAIMMKDYFVDGAPMYFLSRKFFDVIGWLNKKHGHDTQAYRL